MASNEKREVGSEYTDEEVEEVFDEATTLISSSKIPMENEQLLALYGFYKQALEGKCSAPKPGFFDFKGKAKWDAWNQLGDMPKVDAMKRYCEEVHKVIPSWDPWKNRALDKNSKKAAIAPVVSRMQDEEEDEPVTLAEFAGAGDEERVRVLLEKGADANEADAETKTTALHLSADRGNLAISLMLLNAGANVNSQDINGDTPLHNACLCGHKEIISLLLSRGADKQLQNSSNEKPGDLFDISSIE